MDYCNTLYVGLPTENVQNSGSKTEKPDCLLEQGHKLPWVLFKEKESSDWTGALVDLGIFRESFDLRPLQRRNWYIHQSC
ncbi:uncharacterized protein LOC144587889 isoform X3 [Pogona vitticeps]